MSSGIAFKHAPFYIHTGPCPIQYPDSHISTRSAPPPPTFFCGYNGKVSAGRLIAPPEERICGRGWGGVEVWVVQGNRRVALCIPSSPTRMTVVSGGEFLCGWSVLKVSLYIGRGCDGFFLKKFSWTLPDFSDFPVWYPKMPSGNTGLVLAAILLPTLSPCMCICIMRVHVERKGRGKTHAQYSSCYVQHRARFSQIKLIYWPGGGGGEFQTSAFLTWAPCSFFFLQGNLFSAPTAAQVCNCNAH